MKKLYLFIPILALCFYSYGQQTGAVIDSPGSVSDTAKLIFCGGIENDLPVGASNLFFRDTFGNEYIYAWYSQSTPLMMKQVMMEIYRDNNEKAGDTKRFSVNPKWKFTFLKCYFPSKGDYRVSLYDENKKILATGMVTILEGQ